MSWVDIPKNRTDSGHFEKPTPIPTWVFEKPKIPRNRRKKTKNIGYFGISEAAVAVLHMHNCTLHNALTNVVELIKCNA